MIVIASYFFSETLVWFGQLDWFSLPWEEVLCDGFDLAVLNLSDRRRHDTHVSDTSILHHAFISIFIALWVVTTHYVAILMPFLSYFTRFT